MTRAPRRTGDGRRRSAEATTDGTPNPDAVRNALGALAAGTAPSARSAHRETITDATAATDCAVEAAAFLDDGRLPDLARAVAAVRDDESLASDGGPSLADRGAAALETLRRLDAATRAASERASAADHFHPAHGTVLPQTGQAPDR